MVERAQAHRRATLVGRGDRRSDVLQAADCGADRGGEGGRDEHRPVRGEVEAVGGVERVEALGQRGRAGGEGPRQPAAGDLTPVDEGVARLVEVEEQLGAREAEPEVLGSLADRPAEAGQAVER